MKKVVCFGMCFLIVLCSFVLCFADTNFEQPVILPLGDVSDGSSYIQLTYSNNTVHQFSASNSPVYMVAFKSGDITRVLFFSDVPGSFVYDYGQAVTTRALTREYEGFYYTSSVEVLNSDNLMVFPSDITITGVIDDINNSVFKTTFDLTYLIDGSVSWLSTMAQAVKSNGLLLFMVLIGLCGIGIGLFRRFTNG